ncbi:MAG: sugar transferase, partial [Anaerolineales bacterium]|jgi:lipopolysaccharide/colanic/teichoic acid biosynthesis glycosyltransferase
VVFVLFAWRIDYISTRLDDGRWIQGFLFFCVFIIHSLLGFSLIEFGHSVFLNSQWVYRLGFILSAGLGILRWLILPPSSDQVGLFCLAGLLGALSGGMLSTTQHEGLWENNYPPPTDIRRTVRQGHLDIIGRTLPTHFTKRLFDVVFVVCGIILSTPIWLICIFVLWLEDPGPIFFVKNSVGKGGINFHQFKFRTMVRGAERSTGPILAREDDIRALWFGRFLRKTALDELPQLVNILRGEMSFVGPRPQRTILVNEYLKQMPEFAERHRVLPGLSGLAQVAGDYYLTPRQKLRYDSLYTRHSSLGFDIKLILIAFLIVFWLRWRKDWNGRLPRGWLRFGSS